MIFNFPKNCYVRVKTVKEIITTISISTEGILQSDIITNNYAIIYLLGEDVSIKHKIEDVRNTQEEIDRLLSQYPEIDSCGLGEEKKNRKDISEIDIEEIEHKRCQYGDRNITHIPLFMKENMLKDFYKEVTIRQFQYPVKYEDIYQTISEVDNLGNDGVYDDQRVKISLSPSIWEQEEILVEGNYFDDVAGKKEEWKIKMEEI